jgi:hypothetical protein
MWLATTDRAARRGRPPSIRRRRRLPVLRGQQRVRHAEDLLTGGRNSLLIQPVGFERIGRFISRNATWRRPLPLEAGAGIRIAPHFGQACLPDLSSACRQSRSVMDPRRKASHRRLRARGRWPLSDPLRRMCEPAGGAAVSTRIKNETFWLFVRSSGLIRGQHGRAGI